MSDNKTLDPGAGGATIRTKDRTGVDTQIFALDLNPGGAESLMNGTMPVTGTVTATGPLTDTQLRATAVPVSGPLTDTQLRATAVPVSLATLPALVAGSAAIGKLAANSGVNIGDVGVTSLPATPTGSNTIGKVDQGAGGASAWKVDGSAVTQPIVVIGTPAISGAVSLQAGASGTSYTPVLYANQTTTVQTVKGTGGVLAGWMIYNPNPTAIAYVQVFNVASATTVTLGTTVPLMSLPIPPGSAANLSFEVGLSFGTGIKLACTTTALGLTAPSVGLDVNVFYK